MIFAELELNFCFSTTYITKLQWQQNIRQFVTIAACRVLYWALDQNLVLQIYLDNWQVCKGVVKIDLLCHAKKMFTFNIASVMLLVVGNIREVKHSKWSAKLYWLRRFLITGCQDNCIFWLLQLKFTILRLHFPSNCDLYFIRLKRRCMWFQNFIKSLKRCAYSLFI